MILLQEPKLFGTDQNFGCTGIKIPWNEFFAYQIHTFIHKILEKSRGL